MAQHQWAVAALLRYDVLANRLTVPTDYCRSGEMLLILSMVEAPRVTVSLTTRRLSMLL